MEMVRLLLAFAAIPMVTSAAGFSLTVGPPIAAAKVTKTKGAAFAVRLEECGALDKVQISGIAEAVVDGARTSAPVTISDTGSPGVYIAIPAGNQNQGVWVVSLSATCGSARAGAIVPIGPQGFQREGLKILPRAATKAEIDAALKAIENSGR